MICDNNVFVAKYLVLAQGEKKHLGMRDSYVYIL